MRWRRKLQFIDYMSLITVFLTIYEMVIASLAFGKLAMTEKGGLPLSRE